MTNRHLIDAKAATARGNHLAAQNDEPEIHPVFATLLRTAFGPGAAATIRAAQMTAYVKALKSHDWSFPFSDDPQITRAGWESLAQLRVAARELDPEFVVWNEHCHPMCKNGKEYA